MDGQFAVPILQVHYNILTIHAHLSWFAAAFGRLALSNKKIDILSRLITFPAAAF